MHKRLIEQGFNRRFVLVPLLLSIALVVLGFAITEARRAQTRQLDDVLRDQVFAGRSARIYSVRRIRRGDTEVDTVAEDLPDGE